MAWEKGLDGAAVPDMTPSEARGLFEGWKARRRQADEQNWMLGKYVAYGVNAPKKYPSEPFLRPREAALSAPEMTDDEMQAWAKRFAERMNGNEPGSGNPGDPDQSQQ